MTNRIKILWLILFVASTGMYSSCTKVLDQDPSHEVDGSNSFKTIDDYQFALTGAYKLFQQANYYGTTAPANAYGANAFVCLPDMMSDNLNESGESLGNYTILSAWIYAEDEPNIAATWVGAYYIIAQDNVILRSIDNLKGADQGAINRVKAQALAMRAMVHFDILRYWAEEFDRNSTKPGIPYITEFNYNQKPSRGTIKETYDKIEADLVAAKQLMANLDQPINTDSRYYIDEDVVNAILARVSLYSKQWNKAIEYASDVIDNIPLADRSQFPGIWTDVSQAEVIWSLAFNSGEDNIGGDVYFAPNNRSSYAPNETLVNSYDQDNDIRFSSYFKVIDDNDGSPRLVVSKYLAKQSQLRKPDGIVDFKAFRTGEMYLIRAEAYAALNNNAAALADLNTLRAARIKGFVPGTETGNALKNAIALERRKELVCEGHRWFDLKRTTKTIERTECTDNCILLPDDRAWAWPIPIGEINANPSILPQNPGY